MEHVESEKVAVWDNADVASLSIQVIDILLTPQQPLNIKQVSTISTTFRTLYNQNPATVKVIIDTVIPQTLSVENASILVCCVLAHTPQEFYDNLIPPLCQVRPNVLNSIINTIHSKTTTTLCAKLVECLVGHSLLSKIDCETSKLVAPILMAADPSCESIKYLAHHKGNTHLLYECLQNASAAQLNILANEQPAIVAEWLARDISKYGLSLSKIEEQGLKLVVPALMKTQKSVDLIRAIDLPELYDNFLIAGLPYMSNAVLAAISEAQAKTLAPHLPKTAFIMHNLASGTLNTMLLIEGITHMSADEVKSFQYSKPGKGKKTLTLHDYFTNLKDSPLKQQGLTLLETKLHATKHEDSLSDVTEVLDNIEEGEGQDLAPDVPILGSMAFDPWRAEDLSHPWSDNADLLLVEEEELSRYTENLRIEENSLYDTDLLFTAIEEERVNFERDLSMGNIESLYKDYPSE